MTGCPRCGEGVAAGQEYCLECGLRLPGVTRLGPVPTNPRWLALPLLLAAVVAVGGAAAAIALTRDSATATPILTATGGSQAVPTATVAATALAEWPAAKSGWTNILVSVPKVDGRDAAVACGVSACSTPHAIPVSIPATGSCSPASTRVSPRPGAACARRKGCSEVPIQDGSPRDLVAHRGNFDPEFVTRPQTG